VKPVNIKYKTTKLAFASHQPNPYWLVYDLVRLPVRGRILDTQLELRRLFRNETFDKEFQTDATIFRNR